ncbi:hypothetical protein GBA52_019117 [Prunus armeniaca]|nr:hypothetical protein GBA52_019117 [Prunus armeniaca]
MASEKMDPQKRRELDEKARKGEVVIPGGTGRSRGGQTRKNEIGDEGYHEMGKKGGLSTTEKSGGERAAEKGIPLDESKYKTNGRSNE